MKQYEMVELCFKGEAPEEDQVRVNLNGSFSCGEEKVTVRGFYAGNGIYKVRFLPTKAGNWQYCVSGVVNGAGVVTIEPARADRHGIPRAEETHIRFMDGTLFLPFGTTIYGMAHQTEELMAETMETLSKSPFNKVRMCVFPKHYQYNHNEPAHYAFCFLKGKTLQTAKHKGQGKDAVVDEPLWNVTQPQFHFWDELEKRIGQMGELGIIVDLILFHPYDRWGFSRFNREEDLTYLDYLLRRLSAIPNLMWSMANEYDLMETKNLDDWHMIEEYIAGHDPYHHMLSCHNCMALYDYGRKNITHVSIQTRTPARVLELQKTYGKPVFYDECAYEGNLEETFGSLTGEEMSDRFWKVAVTGGYCTHGETFLDYRQTNIDDAIVFWAKGGRLKGESPKRIAFLRKFLESLPGPVDSMLEGMDRLLDADAKQMENMMLYVPENIHPIITALCNMDEKEKIYHILSEKSYEGHIGDDVYLFYYGSDRHARVTLHLPEDIKYRIDVVDTWNMTQETVLRGQSGNTQVHLPERQWMAVAAMKEFDNTSKNGGKSI